MLFSALAFLISVLTGTALVLLWWPRKDLLRGDVWVRLSLAVGLGLGVSSCVCFLWLVVFGLQGSGFFIAEAVLLLFLFATLVYQRNKGLLLTDPELYSPPTPKSKIRRILSIAFYAALISAGVTTASLLVREPHGQYDGLAIWNMRARFIFRGGAHWTDAFSSALMWSHLDYPLLLPLSVVRCWKYAGYDTTIAPALISMSFMLATVGLTVSSVSVLRGGTQGFLAGLVLLAPWLFAKMGASEFADIPIGFFFLATVSLLYLQDKLRDGTYTLLILAGLTAGLAAWTKNEGLLFLVSITLARLVVVGTTKGLRVWSRQMGFFAIGLSPVLLLLMYFKFRFAPANDLIGAQAFDTAVRKLLDPSRYFLVLKAFRDQLMEFGGWAANPLYLLAIYPLCLGVRIENQNRTGLATSVLALCLVGAGYFFIYVTSPHADLHWHLTSSLDRLLLQLWPACVLTYFIIVRSPERALASENHSHAK